MKSKGSPDTVVDHRHELLSQGLESGEVRRVYHGQALAQDPVAHLDVHPRGEVVRVGAGDQAVAQQEAVGVVVDRVKRDLVQELDQLALVLGA